MSVRSLFLSLRRLWQGTKPALVWLDRCFVGLAALFGVNQTDPLRRYGTLLGIYAVLYALALLPLPVLPLLALAVGYVGILAVGRAWVANEKHRTDIVKKLSNADPDALPDLHSTPWCRPCSSSSCSRCCSGSCSSSTASSSCRARRTS